MVQGAVERERLGAWGAIPGLCAAKPGQYEKD
jgi:hypothetical protein